MSLACYDCNPCSGKSPKTLEVQLHDDEGRWLRMNPKRIVNIILEHPAKRVVLLGGDPFGHPALRPIIEEVGRYKTELIVNTNASNLQHLNSEMFLDQRLFLNITRINLEIFSHDETINKRLHGLKKAVMWANLHHMLYDLPRRIKVGVNCTLLKDATDNDTNLLHMIYLAQSFLACEITFREADQLARDDGFIAATDFSIFRERRHMRREEPFTEGCTVTDQKWFDNLCVTLKTCCGYMSPEHRMPTTFDGHNPNTDVLYTDGSLEQKWMCASTSTNKEKEDEE